MFFKDLSTWSKKKLRGLNFLFSFLHFVALVLIPIIIVAHNYKLFTNYNGLKLTAVGIIVVIILGLYSYIKLKNVIDELPQLKLSQQRFKFSSQGVLSLIPILIICAGLEYAKNDFNVAIIVIRWCCVSFIGAILIDALFLKYINQEYSLRTKALEMVEIEKRKGLV